MAAEVQTKDRRGLVDPGQPSSEPFRALRLALQLRAETQTGNIVLFTSAEPGEGKSTIAANFALVSSLSHTSVLIIDGDLRKPTLHEFFGVQRAPGLVELLADGSSPRDLAQAVPGLGQLDVLCAGRPIPRAGDLAASHKMGDLLRRASEQYGLVVVDSPPLLSAADASGLASHPGVEVVLVVRRKGRRRAVRNALRKLQLIEANVAGIVVNREGRLTSYSY
jgi:capsular exopolysaccharide synthesis family protein